MAQSPPNDSQLELTFTPLSETGDSATWRNFDSSVDLSEVNQLPVFDLASEEPLPDIPEDAQKAPAKSPSKFREPATRTAPSPTDSAASTFWLEGDVVMCGCPDCRAPMSVRLWLMIADCWHCGTSIELTEEQEREVRRLLEEREKKQAVAAAPTPTQKQPAPTPKQAAAASAASAASRPTPSERTETPKQRQMEPAAKTSPTPRPKEETKPAPTPATPAKTTPTSRHRTGEQPAATPQADPRREEPGPGRRRVPASQGLSIGARARIRKMAAAGTTSVWINDLFRMTPAWLISAVIHFVLLMLLALFNVPRDDDKNTIVLSSSVHKSRNAGEAEIKTPADELNFDLPLPENVDVSDADVKAAMIRADQDAREIRMDPNDPNPNLPDLERVKQRIHGPHGIRNALAARDPRVRIDMVKHEGGTTRTEAAVARALRWMSKHQNPDGSWSLHAVHKPDGKCNCTAGGTRSNMAGTSLALLPFLGAGQTHLTGMYKDNVAGGLRWMIQNQGTDGRLISPGDSSQAFMYAHGQGTIVLCEAFAMEGDESLRVPAQKAVDFIVKAQHPAGGWRYQPRQAGDTSVVGWQLMALQSARAAGLDVQENTLKLASKFLDSVAYTPMNGRTREPLYAPGSRYGYTPRSAAKNTMTAEALLCRMYLGWNRKEHPEMMEGIQWLTSEPNLPSAGRKNMYYWYYATQTMHHAGGQDWVKWNQRMREILVDTQETKGCPAGSWSNAGFQYGTGGRLYVTALATCSLEVYYRHLPIFKQIELGQEN